MPATGPRLPERTTYFAQRRALLLADVEEGERTLVLVPGDFGGLRRDFVHARVSLCYRVRGGWRPARLVQYQVQTLIEPWKLGLVTVRIDRRQDRVQVRHHEGDDNFVEFRESSSWGGTTGFPVETYGRLVGDIDYEPADGSRPTPGTVRFRLAHDKECSGLPPWTDGGTAGDSGRADPVADPTRSPELRPVATGPERATEA